MARAYKKRTSYRRSSRSSRRSAQRRARSSVVTRARRMSTYRNRMWVRNSLRGRNPLALNKCSTVLKYNTTILLNPKPDALGVTASNTYQFSANGMYDPDITSTGHQPMYFDNYASVYQRYHVKYSTISVTVVNHAVNTATANSSGTVTSQPNYSYKLAIITDGTNGVTTQYPGYMEQVLELGGANVKWRFVGPTLTGRLPRLKTGCAPHKVVQKGFKDTTLQAATNVNPTRVFTIM